MYEDITIHKCRCTVIHTMHVLKIIKSSHAKLNKELLVQIYQLLFVPHRIAGYCMPMIEKISK